MLCTPAQARFDESRVSATVDASDDDDLVAGHAEPKRVLEATKKDPSVSAVEVPIREGIADGSSDRFIDRPAKFGSETGTLSFQPILDRFEVTLRRSADDDAKRQRLRFSRRTLTSDHAL